MKKRIIKIAAFLVGFLLINLLLCGFMPPDNGSSLAMWRNYHSKDSVDIAVIGSSLASCALPEEELAAATGKSVALMATNSQSWDMSKIALESVLREHTPQYVILVMDLYNMTGEPYPKAQKAFLSAELQTSRWQDRPAELLRYMTSADRFTGADSLNALFPWQGGNWPTDWPATIRQKWNALTARIAARGAAHGQPEGDTVIDFDTVGNVNTWNQTNHPFTQQHIDELVSMMQLCQEKGVPLLVISAPKTTLDVISYDTYFDDYAFFKKLAGLYGASYYDFNFAKQELSATRNDGRDQRGEDLGQHAHNSLQGVLVLLGRALDSLLGDTVDAGDRDEIIVEIADRVADDDLELARLGESALGGFECFNFGNVRLGGIVEDKAHTRYTVRYRRNVLFAADILKQ